MTNSTVTDNNTRKGNNMTNEVTESTFIKPYYIAALGCEGLTSKEIAASIGMEKRNLHTLIQKLQQSGDLAEVQQTTVTTDGINKAVVYLLNTDDAKFVVTQSSTPAGRGYCRFLIECEKVALTPKTPVLPSNYIEALKALVVSEEEKMVVQAQLAIESAEKDKAIAIVIEQAPKAAFFEAYVDSEGLLSMNEAAKALGMGRNTLFDTLREAGVFMGTIPKQTFINRGYFQLKLWENNGRCGSVTRVTPKGMVWLSNESYLKEEPKKVLVRRKVLDVGFQT
jgi:phage antirepressor YoqD-like protein